jgi:hypothetical protein
MFHAYLYTICFVFCYTSWRFYAFSGTNLLTRRHSASSLFSAIFLFQKSYTGNILGIGRNKSWTSYFSRTRVEVQSRDGGGPGPSHTLGRRGPGPGHATRGWAPLVHLLTPPFRLYIPLDGKNLKAPINFPQNILQAAAVVDVRSGGSRSSSRHPAGEGNPCWRPSSSPWSPLGWCVSSLPWTTGP